MRKAVADNVCQNASGVEKHLTFLRLAEGRLTEQDLAGWIRERLTGG